MKMSNKLNIAVIGGGASGLIAAISAKNENTDVTIYEKEKRVGRKILATGNGRCNMTNTTASYNDYHSLDIKFIYPTIERFWVDKTLDFFENIGILWKEEDEGKVYPYSDTASAVLDVLRQRLEKIGVITECEFGVKKIKKQNNQFIIEDKNGKRKRADRVIIATGGMAGAQLGSDGSGYKLLESLGHKITKLYPSLVQIRTQTDTVKKLKGIKVNAKVSVGDKEKTGEVLFTDYGISGPPVFWLSSYIEGEKEITLDIMPEYSYTDISDMITKRVNTLGDIPLEDFFVGMLNKRVSQALLKHIGVEPLSRLASSLSRKEIQAISNIIKNFKLQIKGTSTWNNAQVTKGGADVSQFNADTMESRLVKGLYCCGEVLDVDGDCGGYNLQWAWSSGYIAGIYASGREMEA